MFCESTRVWFLSDINHVIRRGRSVCLPVFLEPRRLRRNSVPTIPNGLWQWASEKNDCSAVRSPAVCVHRNIIKALGIRDRERSSVIQEEIRVEQMLLYRHLTRISPGCLLGEVFHLGGMLNKDIITIG